MSYLLRLPCLSAPRVHHVTASAHRVHGSRMYVNSKPMCPSPIPFVRASPPFSLAAPCLSYFQFRNCDSTACGASRQCLHAIAWRWSLRSVCAAELASGPQLARDCNGGPCAHDTLSSRAEGRTPSTRAFRHPRNGKLRCEVCGCRRKRRNGGMGGRLGMQPKRRCIRNYVLDLGRSLPVNPA